jgi:hypothetical protein
MASSGSAAERVDQRRDSRRVPRPGIGPHGGQPDAVPARGRRALPEGNQEADEAVAGVTDDCHARLEDATDHRGIQVEMDQRLLRAEGDRQLFQ